MKYKYKKFLVVILIVVTFLNLSKINIFATEKNVTSMSENIVPYFIQKQNTSKDKLRYTVLILDISGSMYGTPISNEKIAAQKFCSSMLESDGSNYIAIIAYSDSVHLICDYTDNIQTLTSSFDNIYASGGTNSNAALLEASQLIKTVPENATKNIVFLSDGIPESGIQTIHGPYTSNDSSYYKYANALYATSQDIQKECNLYSLGFFHDLEGSELVFGQKLMEDIQNAGYQNVEDVNDLEFAFGEISDDIIESTTKKNYVNQHKNYYQSKEYVSEITTNYPEILMQIYDETLKDNTVLIYDTLDTLNKYLRLDLASLDGSDEYKLLLSDIISGQMDVEQFYQDNLKITTVNIINYFMRYIDKNFDSIINKNTTNKKILLDKMKEYANIMQQENWGTDNYENAYKGLKKTVNDSIDIDNTKKILKEHKTTFNIAVDIANVGFSTVDKVLDYYIAAQSYISLTEEMKDVLKTLKDTINNQNIKNQIIKDNNTNWIDSKEFLDSLQSAITEYMDIITTFEKGNATEIGMYIVKEGGCNIITLGADKFSDYLWSLIPLMKGVKTSTNIIQTLVDAGTPNLHLRSYSANLLARLRYIHMFMKYTIDYYGEALSNNNDTNKAFSLALRFDSAINLYKSIQILACDYAEQYEICCFESNTDTMHDMELKPLAYGPFVAFQLQNIRKERSWNCIASSLAQVQKFNTQTITCHSGDFSYDNSNGVIQYNNSQLKIVTIACPVSVYINDSNGKQVAFLSNNEINISSGYEPYFYTYANDNQSDNRTKIAIIPSDENYEILLKGTDSGTMDVNVGIYEKKKISNLDYITNIPINKDSEMKLEFQNGHTALKTDTNYIYLENTPKDDISMYTTSLSNETYIYDGKEKTPTVIIKNGEKQLISGIDYMIFYKNNINVGTAEVIINGKGNYTGTIVKTFLIKKADIETEIVTETDIKMKSLFDCQITLSTLSFIYTGKKQTPSVTIKDGNTILRPGIDYTISYHNNINSGKATILISGKGIYKGTITKNFTIKKAKQKLSCIKSYKKVYGNKAFMLNVKRSNKGGKLTYKSSNKKVVSINSKGKVTLKGSGYATIIVKADATNNYNANSIKITIKVCPIKQTIQATKFIKGENLIVNWKKDINATGYQIQFSTDKNFKNGVHTITERKNKKTSTTIRKLTNSKNYYIRQRSYKNIKVNGKSQKLYSAWSNVIKISKKM